MISVPRKASRLVIVRKLKVVNSSNFVPNLWIFLAIGVLATLTSCKTQSTPISESQHSGGASSEEASTPEGKLHDQLSSGIFQADASVSSITGAIQIADEMAKSVKMSEAGAAITDVLDVLNFCGKSMAELIDESPDEAEIKKDFVKYDDLRIKAVEIANDCLHDLEEANGVLDSLKSELSGDSLGELTLLQTQIAEAMDDVIGTIEGFGGKVEPIG